MGVPCCRLYLVTDYEPGKETDLRETSLVVKNVEERSKSKNKFKYSKTVETRHNYNFYTVILIIKTTNLSLDPTTLGNIFFVELGELSVCHKTLILEPSETL